MHRTQCHHLSKWQQRSLTWQRHCRPPVKALKTQSVLDWVSATAPRICLIGAHEELKQDQQPGKEGGGMSQLSRILTLNNIQTKVASQSHVVHGGHTSCRSLESISS